MWRDATGRGDPPPRRVEAPPLLRLLPRWVVVIVEWEKDARFGPVESAIHRAIGEGAALSDTIECLSTMLLALSAVVRSELGEEEAGDE